MSHPSVDSAIQRLPDGTVKQRNLLTGTEVWTVPGRGNRPIMANTVSPEPVDHSHDGQFCAFCEQRYLETPPEKARLVRHEDGCWEKLTGLPAEELSATTADVSRTFLRLFPTTTGTSTTGTSHPKYNTVAWRNTWLLTRDLTTSCGSLARD